MTAAPNLIDIHVFMQHLKAEGLVIVRGDELEQGKQLKLREMQRRLMKRKAVTFKQVVDAQLLPLESKEGIMHWVRKGKIKAGTEAYQEKNKRWMLLTDVIRRLGYVE